MSQKIAFMLLIAVTFLFGVAYGFSGRLLWEYKSIALAGLAALIVYFAKKNIVFAAIAAVAVYFILEVLL